MTDHDPTDVPAQPAYALLISPDEEHGLVLSLDGATVTTGHDIEQLREAGRRELQVRAALAGRPVRARAVEPASPHPWNLIMCPDGTVFDAVAHSGPSRPPAAPAGPAPTPDLVDPEPAPSADERGLLPEVYRPAWNRMVDAHQAGDTPAAVMHAYHLETLLSAAYGPQDPHTVQVLSARAWLTMVQKMDLAGTVELLILTALRRQGICADQAETEQFASNAFGYWGRLLADDAPAALALAPALADLLAILGWEERRGLVLMYAEAQPTAAG
ncbi:hypothetical protein [Streptomyces sp. NPDC089919]|uniref:hypothetical protein n=1 Tax=Streptomyces sp. NPDC089919 TaxID=3155188 RepID=UPI00343A444E